MCQAVHEHGATTYASLSVLSDQLVQRASMDRVVTIYINREQEAVVVKEPDPPPAGVADGGILPSFWMRAGRPACICARIATALFSHRVRSYSSRALCANVPVCSGAFWAVGVPNARMKGLSGSVEDGRSAIAATARQMSPSLTS